MKFSKPFVGLLCCLIFLSSCENPTGNHSKKNVSAPVDTTKTPTDSKTIDAPASSQHDYFFQPATSVLTGTLKVEMFYGPPNFGESPETDAREYPYIFYPDNPINVLQTADSSDYDVTTTGITKIQLAPVGELSLRALINKKIRVTGQFYGAHTGYHYTDVLLTTEKAEVVE